MSNKEIKYDLRGYEYESNGTYKAYVPLSTDDLEGLANFIVKSTKQKMVTDLMDLPVLDTLPFGMGNLINLIYDPYKGLLNTLLPIVYSKQMVDQDIDDEECPEPGNSTPEFEALENLGASLISYPKEELKILYDYVTALSRTEIAQYIEEEIQGCVQSVTSTEIKIETVLDDEDLIQTIKYENGKINWDGVMLSPRACHKVSQYFLSMEDK